MAGTDKTDKATNHPPGNGEERSRDLFSECPVPLLEEDLTDLKEHLDKLRSSGVTDLRTHFAGHAEEVVTCAGLVRIVAVNRATLSLYEAPDEKSLLAGLSTVFTEESFGTFQEIMIALFEGKNQFETAGINRTLLGKKIHVNLKWSLLPESNGKPTRALVSIEDITGRKQAAEKLRESEDMFRSIFEQAIDGIMIADPVRKRNIEANSAICNMLGYTRDEILSRRLEDLHPQEELPRILDLFERQVRGEISLAPDITMLRKDGSVVYVDVNATRVTLGGKQCIMGIFRDITERKLAEEALQESERSLKTLMSNLPGMAYRCCNDRNWTMEYVSEGAAALTGYQPADLTGNAKIAYNDLIHHDDQKPVWETVQKTIGSRDKFRLSYRIRRADGQERWVWEQGQGVFSLAGDLLALEGFIIDVSERRLLEEERLKTQKLEAIGTLAGGIAHDFNNLLQGVFGYISLAKLSADQKEKSVAALEQAEKALHLSVNLTSQLLTFSKGGKPVKQRIDLRPMIENAARFALSGSRSDYLLDISDDLWAADADSGQLGQVIQNIVLNADQAMPEGGHVEITAINVQAPNNDLPQGLHNGRYVKISIKDNGIGISEQYLAKIFDPYFTTKEKGSGLGLATSYSIVRNHGGFIDVQSLPGKGSTFVVYIPAAALVATKPIVAAVIRPALKGRILVMDDDEVVRMVAGELIRALGHDVDFAEHGDAAISKYRTARESGDPFDVIILDLTIRGGMGGMETIQKLREIDPEVKAVVSSGYSDNAATAEYQMNGFRSFLKKPYNIEELRDTLNALLT